MPKRHRIDWVEDICREWGRHIREKYLGDDGFPSKSILVAFREGGQTGHSAWNQFFPEFPPSEIRGMSEAFRSLNDHGQRVVFAHYVVKGMSPRRKAQCLGWPVRTYWWRLSRTNARLAGKLSPPTTCTTRGSIPTMLGKVGKLHVAPA